VRIAPAMNPGKEKRVPISAKNFGGLAESTQWDEKVQTRVLALEFSVLRSIRSGINRKVSDAHARSGKALTQTGRTPGQDHCPDAVLKPLANRHF
jgi:hypothetical protein